MHYLDVSLPLEQGMPCFPGDPEFCMSPHFIKKRGDPFNLASVSLSTHTGTHIDPPAHYIDGGVSVDELPVQHMIGTCIVLDLRGINQIDRLALGSSSLGNYRRVLFKTDNSALLKRPGFYHEYVYLTEDGAEYLVEKGVVLVGIDYLSIEKFMNPGAPVHKALMKAGIIIVETLNLFDVPEGEYELFCLPLLIKGADGAPARVVLGKNP